MEGISVTNEIIEETDLIPMASSPFIPHIHAPNTVMIGYEG